MSLRAHPVDPHDSPLATLAYELNALRARSGGISYRRMADQARFSHTTLSRAAHGKDLPTWEVTEAFVRACGGNPHDWRDKWEAARDSVLVRRRSAPGDDQVMLESTHVAPLRAVTVKDFIRTLRSIKLYCGDPSYKVIASRAGRPISTVADVFNTERRQLPNWPLVEAVLRALAVEEIDLSTWRKAWHKVATPVTEQRWLPGDNSDILLRQIGEIGLEGVYPTRVEALSSFVRPLEQEIENGPAGRLWIVGSSMKGFSVQVIGQSDGVAVIRRAINANCDVRLIFTHPTQADDRAEQEKRQFGAIHEEIFLNLANLKEAGLKQQNVRFCKGAPTVFGICTTDRMLLNPYPYGCEAYLNFSMVLRKTHRPDGIFERYFEKHFEKSWTNGVEVGPEEWNRYDNRKNGSVRPRSRRS